MRALLAVLLGTFFLAIPAAAGPDSAPWSDLQEDRGGWSRAFAVPGFDGYVRHLARHDGRLVVGGSFGRVGRRPIGPLAVWDGQLFRSTDLFGSVAALVENGSELVVGGRLQWKGSGTEPVLIARWDGRDFEPIGDLGGSWVLQIVPWHDGWVVEGSYLRVDGVLTDYAWFDGAGWHALPSPAPGKHHLAVHDGELYAARNSVFRWVPPDHWEVAFTCDGWVDELLSYEGDLIAAGGFTSIDGVPADRLARWDGEQWEELGGGVQDQGVRLLRDLGDGRLLVGGNFRVVNQVEARGFAIWNGTAWETPGQGIREPSDAILHDGDLVLCGTLFSWGDFGHATQLARWTGETWRAFSYEGQGLGLPHPWAETPIVEVLVPRDDGLLAGGSFRMAGGRPTAGIARFDGTEWHAIGDGFNRFVYALAYHGDELVAGGNFSMTGWPSQRPVQRVARWDGSAWGPMGDGLGASVRSLISFDGELVAGGDRFAPLSHWDGAAWSPLGGETDGDVLVLYEHRGRLIAGGSFSRIGGEDIANLASWDGTRFEAVGGGTDGVVHDVTTYRGELVVGGDFERAGGEELPRLARWNGASWRGFDESLLSAWTIPGTRAVSCLVSVREVEAIGGHLYVGGDPLIGTESVPAEGIIRWSEADAEWSALDDGVPWRPQHNLRALAGYRGAVFVGGPFEAVDDGRIPSSGVAAWWPRSAGATPVPRGTGVPELDLGLRAGPNPFRTGTSVGFHLPEPGRVRLTIHDVQGRLVTQLLDGPTSAGHHAPRWNGSNRFGRRVPSGVYFVRLHGDAGTVSRKLVRLD
jgi:hypothetical protein